MNEEKEVLLVGGPRDGHIVRHSKTLAFPENEINTPRTVNHGGRYVKRHYASPQNGVLELFVWRWFREENEDGE